MKKALLFAGIILIGFSAKSQTSQFAPYVPRYDVNTYARVAEEMQRKYDANVRLIRESVNQTNELFERASLDPSVRKQLNDSYSKLLDQMSVHGTDWSQTNTCNWALDNLSAIRGAIRKHEL